MIPNYKCPVCGTESHLIVSKTQAFCENESCRVLSFNPSLPDGGMSDMHEVDLAGFENPEKDS